MSILLDDGQMDNLIPSEAEIQSFLNEPCTTSADYELDKLLSDDMKHEFATHTLWQRKVAYAQARAILTELKTVEEIENIEPFLSAFYTLITRIESELEGK